LRWVLNRERLMVTLGWRGVFKMEAGMLVQRVIQTMRDNTLNRPACREALEIAN
jgi:hypothetical protein